MKIVVQQDPAEYYIGMNLAPHGFECRDELGRTWKSLGCSPVSGLAIWKVWTRHGWFGVGQSVKPSRIYIGGEDAG